MHQEIIFGNTEMNDFIKSIHHVRELTSLVAILKPRFILARRRSMNLYRSECSSGPISYKKLVCDSMMHIIVSE